MFEAVNSSMLIVGLICLAIFISLVLLNEITRRWKWAGFAMFFVVPVVLSILWFAVPSMGAYMDWFHLAKVYSSTAGCIGFWLIRFLEKKDKLTGEVTWRLRDNKWALCFPPMILIINILEACMRDFELGIKYWGVASGGMEGEVLGVIGGPWNIMNGVAGLLNILLISGFVGICIRRETKSDKSHDMLWPDMIWIYILAYDAWNFMYTYNCIPTHSFYTGIAMLLAPTFATFVLGKGAWLQHRAHTLAIWCMFAQTFPLFQDQGVAMVASTYNPTIYFIGGLVALLANLAGVVYMIMRVVKTKRNPLNSELYTNMKAYKEVKALAE